VPKAAVSRCNIGRRLVKHLVGDAGVTTALSVSAVLDPGVFDRHVPAFGVAGALGVMKRRLCRFGMDGAAAAAAQPSLQSII
jgi:hypothetical protein